MNQTCDKDFVHVVTTPDSYRGKYRGSDEETGIEYANEIKEAIENARNKGRKVITVFCYPLHDYKGFSHCLNDALILRTS